jgi:O-antigen ligase
MKGRMEIDTPQTGIVPSALEAEPKKRHKAKGAYLALLVLSALYFGRPEDVIPGLHVIPLAKIAGGIALVALILALLSGRRKEKLASEVKLLLALFVWYCITIPFAYWRGGAFTTVMTRLSKSIIAALLVVFLVRELWQLKRLIWVQAASVAAMTLLSVAMHHTPNGRLTGALGGVFENPNDLAINIALNWPLCLAFFFMARGAFKKALWAGALLAMLLAVQMTYSRSGFLALMAACVLALWQFAIRGRRIQLIFVAGLLAVLLLVAAPGKYFNRLASIVVKGETDRSGEASREQRRQLLIDSIMTAVHHPLFGIGAGNFEAVNGMWRVAHNTYTEVAAEGGFPAFILFMLLFYKAFADIRRVRKSQLYKENADVRILGDGLWVSVPAFMAGAFFASTEYSMYPYYLVAYTTALYQIACVQPAAAKQEIDRFARVKSGMDRDVAVVYASQGARTENTNSSAKNKIQGWGYKWNSSRDS